MVLIFKDTLNKILKTFFIVFLIVNLFALGPVLIFLFNVITEEFPYDAKISKLNLSSTIYITDDETGVTKEYTKAYTNENRIWVDFKKIPRAMKDAIVAIEDKRFYSHFGIDPKRLCGAFLSLARGKMVYGGSTLTQQLIKNLTGENDVSITRKLKEIIRSLNFERNYSKDEILELYLNTVNFGSGCYGVQAAANLYFNKDISKCSIAECATIAGITQNPCAYTPLVNPENNKERREIVLSEMFNQGKITDQEYKKALEESSKMTFKRRRTGKKQENVKINDWYTEALLNDVINDLSTKYKLRRDIAEKMVYTQGLKIYSAMDPVAQEIAERVICDSSIFSGDKKVEVGFYMMAPNGRVLAIVGSRNKKTANRILCRATLTRRQPGSAFKPISVYAPAMDLGLIDGNSMLDDTPLPDYFGKGRSGPRNWYKSYKGKIPISLAIQLSSNAPVANLLLKLTNRNSYNFLTQKLNFSSLDKEDLVSSPSLALGGLHKGVTVKEMTAGFQIFANGGVYNKPYTYHYVLDNSGKILLDNRNNVGKRVIGQKAANTMYKLLTGVTTSGTGKAANIPGVETFGKTGTTDKNKDSWFVGGIYGEVTAGIWTGHDDATSLTSTHYSKTAFKEIVSQYHSKIGKKKTFGQKQESSSEVKEVYCCKETGMLALENCPVKEKVCFAEKDVPPNCNKHVALVNSTDKSKSSYDFKKEESSKQSEYPDLEENMDGEIDESAFEDDED